MEDGEFVTVNTRQTVMVKGQTIKVSWFMPFEMSTNFYVVDMSRNKGGHKSKSLKVK